MMDIKIEVSDHEHSKSLVVIEVRVLNILGVWRKIDSWSCFAEVAQQKVDELVEFYAQTNWVFVDSNVSFVNSIVEDTERRRSDSTPASSEHFIPGQGRLFEGPVTRRPVLSVVRGSGTSKPSPSLETSADARASSLESLPEDLVKAWILPGQSDGE